MSDLLPLPNQPNSAQQRSEQHDDKIHDQEVFAASLPDRGVLCSDLDAPHDKVDPNVTAALNVEDLTEEMEIAALHTFLLRHPPVHPFGSLTPALKRALVGALWTKQRADGLSGSKNRSLRVCDAFMRQYPDVFRNNNCRARCTVATDVSKTGKQEVAGTIPHVIPILDSSVWNGLYQLMRYEYGIMRSPPKFDDIEDLTSRLAYSAPHSEKKPFSSAAHKDGFEYIVKLALGELAGPGRLTKLSNVTTRYRGEPIPRSRSRSLKHPSVPDLLGNAGADPTNPKGYRPCWNQIPVPIKLIELLRPGLLAQIERLRGLYRTLNAQQKEEQRIVTCLLSAEACLNDLRSFLQFLACRPVVRRNNVLVLERDQPSYFQSIGICQGFFALLDFGVFRSPLWHQFLHQNLTAQIRHHDSLRNVVPHGPAPDPRTFPCSTESATLRHMIPSTSAHSDSASDAYRTPSSRPTTAQDPATQTSRDVLLRSLEAAANLIYRPPAEDDTLPDGRPRKKRRPVSQADQALYVSLYRKAEAEGILPPSLLTRPARVEPPLQTIQVLEHHAQSPLLPVTRASTQLAHSAGDPTFRGRPFVATGLDGVPIDEEWSDNRRSALQPAAPTYPYPSPPGYYGWGTLHPPP